MRINELAFHPTVARYGTLALDVNIAKAAGFSALELSSVKLQQYFAAGYSKCDLQALLDGLSIPGIGWLGDIERTGTLYAGLMAEAESLFSLATDCGATGIQVLTGPLNVNAIIDHQQHGTSRHYRGVLGYAPDQQKKITAGNLRALADLAAGAGLVLYLEALAWTPMAGIAHQIELIDRADRPNIKLLIDFWHCYASGETPDTVSRINPHYLYGVHVCDSLEWNGEVPDETILRDVPTGAGVLDLNAWVQAVKATGYDGWWSCELFCRKQHQADSFQVAQEHFNLLNTLLNE